jgi:hypothetical protein
MFRGSRILSLVLSTVLAAGAFTAPAAAGDFPFDVPELAGLYDVHHGHRHVALDLGMPFAQIEGVSLRLVGHHTPGIIQLLSHHAPEEPYPAEVFGGLPEAGDSLTTAFDQLLPPEAGPFDRTFHFDDLRYHGDGPNFDPLLDGHAVLNLSVGGPPVIAIYSIKSFPSVDIHSATLIVHGQPELDMFMLPGDYDRNGQVDDGDYAIWRGTLGSSSDLRADGNDDGMIDAADYAVWRKGLHSDIHHGAAAAAGTSVPEPAAFVLAGLASGSLLAFRRDRARG